MCINILLSPCYIFIKNSLSLMVFSSVILSVKSVVKVYSVRPSKSITSKKQTLFYTMGTGFNMCFYCICIEGVYTAPMSDMVYNIQTYNVYSAVRTYIHTSLISC